MRAPLTPRLADRLRRLRQQRGWSLDELTDRSGVSRATLSRIEHAEVSPTADSLARICAAFDLSVSRLVMSAEDRHAPLVAAADQPVRQDPDTGIRRHDISPPAPSLSASVTDLSLPPAATLRLDTPDHAGREHHLVLRSGVLEVVVDGARHALAPGDCLRFHPQDTVDLHAGPDLGALVLMIVA